MPNLLFPLIHKWYKQGWMSTAILQPAISPALHRFHFSPGLKRKLVIVDRGNVHDNECLNTQLFPSVATSVKYKFQLDSNRIPLYAKTFPPKRNHPKAWNVSFKLSTLHWISFYSRKKYSTPSLSNGTESFQRIALRLPFEFFSFLHFYWWTPNHIWCHRSSRTEKNIPRLRISIWPWPRRKCTLHPCTHTQWQQRIRLGFSSQTETFYC